MKADSLAKGGSDGSGQGRKGVKESGWAGRARDDWQGWGQLVPRPLPPPGLFQPLGWRGYRPGEGREAGPSLLPPSPAPPAASHPLDAQEK